MRAKLHDKYLDEQARNYSPRASVYIQALINLFCGLLFIIAIEIILEPSDFSPQYLYLVFYKLKVVIYKS